LLQWTAGFALLEFSTVAYAQRDVDRKVTVHLDSIAAAHLPPRARKQPPRPAPIPNQPSLSVEVRPSAGPALPDGRRGASYTGFTALLDQHLVAPPDCSGAAGPGEVVTMLNAQVAIQSRTGAMRANYPIGLGEFWSGLGTFDRIFDPRILYDAGADRWIASAGADPYLSTAALLLGVSETGDPGGNWTLVEIQTGLAGYWPDYPVIGLSRSWIVLSASLYAAPPVGAYASTDVYVFAKSGLYQKGDSRYLTYKDYQGEMVPVNDPGGQEDVLYFAQAFAGAGGGRYRIGALHGPVGSESFVAGAFELSSGDGWAEAPNNADFLPQRGGEFKVDGGDARLQNCLMGHGLLWCAHTVFVPAANPTRAAIAWFAADPVARRIVQSGRIDDPANAVFYAYPSIAVNASGDALIGYSRFTANDYPSAGFSFRLKDDPPNTMRPGVVAKAGEAPYIGPNSDESANRWGDFSVTMVDPADNLSFWTLQEYAAVPTDYYPGRWGTWWTRVALPSFACAEERLRYGLGCGK